MSKLHVLAVHGIGRQERTFAAALHQRLGQALRRLSVLDGGHALDEVLTFVPVWWADIAEAAEERLLNTLYPPQKLERPSLLQPGLGAGISRWLRGFAISDFGDVFVYLSDDYGPRIKGRFKEAVASLREGHADQEAIFVSVIAHSWGSVVAYEALHEMTHAPEAEGGAPLYGEGDPRILDGVYLANLFTTGSPLAIMGLTEDASQANGHRHHFRPQKPPFFYRRGGVWYNFYDEQDYISFPLEPIIGGLTNLDGQPFVKDIAVDNSLTPIPIWAHNYFANEREVITTIAARLAVDYVQGAIEGAAAAAKHAGRSHGQRD